MSSNSLNFKGLQHGKSLEAQCFPSQCVNNKNPKKERDLVSLSFGTRHRKQCLQVILGLFLMFNAANSYAQIGSSNSNPHLINLNYGAGYGEFQFHYPDTVMYVKLVGLQNKQNFYFNIDTTSSLVIKRITIKKIDNLANNIYDSEVSSLNYNLSLNNIYFTNIDSALLLIKKESFSNSCNYCDTANLKLGISLIQQILPDCSGDPRYCDNLVRNGDLEQFAPQFDENIPTETSPPYTGTFVFPHWGILGMDESATCGWNYEWYTQPGGYTMEVSPTYVNSWFDDPLTFPTCTLNIPINTLFQCNNLSACKNR